MPLKTLDAVLTQQVFLTGRIMDALLGRPVPVVPAIHLLYREAPERRYALGFRQTPDGQYAFFGEPVTSFPDITPPDILQLRLVVSAPGYVEQRLDVTFTAANLTLANVTRQIAGRPVDVPFRINLPIVRDFALLPVPVHLAGRVVNRDEPDVPVANAQVRITAPQPRGPVTANASGYYSLPDLPVALEVTAQVTAAGFETLQETVNLDYRIPLNQHSFALEPS
jgi:hypothetical protein